MGLVKAALGAASGVMGDQWKEYFYCSALPAEVLAVKGQKKVSGRSSNRHGTENIITDGSIVAVAEGQCALIVEQGKVVDLCAEAGEYTYNTGTQPSLLSEGLAKNIDEVFAEIGKRFSFGGQSVDPGKVDAGDQVFVLCCAIVQIKLLVGLGGLFGQLAQSGKVKTGCRRHRYRRTARRCGRDRFAVLQGCRGGRCACIRPALRDGRRCRCGSRDSILCRSHSSIRILGRCT